MKEPRLREVKGISGGALRLMFLLPFQALSQLLKTDINYKYSARGWFSVIIQIERGKEEGKIKFIFMI